MNLRSLQETFGEAVIRNDPGVLLDHLALADDLKRVRFSTYPNNFYISLYQVLSSTYSVLTKIFGEDFSRMIYQEYTRTYPPHSGVLGDFGDKMSGFLREHKHIQDFMADIAQLQWLVSRMTPTGQLPQQDFRLLERTPAEDYSQLKVELAPQGTLFRSPYNIRRFFEEEDPNKIQLDQVTQDSSYCFIYPLETQIKILWIEDEATYVFYESLHAKKTLGEGVELAWQKNPNFQMQEAWAFALSNGIFTAIII